MSFWVYILRCTDNSYYTGHTDNLEQRIGEHQNGLCGGYTASRLPVELVFSQECPTREEALAAEQQIKGWSRKKKEAMMRGDWVEVSRLARGSDRDGALVHPSTSSGRTGSRSPFIGLRADMNKKTTVEKLSSGLPVNIVANTVGVFGATITPLAAFVPFLIQTLASGRQSQRLEKMFGELTAVLDSQSEKLKELSDDQYKLVNEAISAAFYTVDEKKLMLLKNAVVTAVEEPDITESTAEALSRAIRDISADEARFIVNNYYHYSKLCIDPETPLGDGGLAIQRGSNEEVLMSGLISLGLVYSAAPTFDNMEYEWSPLVSKLARLLAVDK